MQTFDEALTGLQREAAIGEQPHPKRPRKVAISKLSTVPEVFQESRHELVSLQRFGEHVVELLRRIKSGAGLDPMSIWWSGTRWIVIEGHHRIEAYREHAKEKAIPEDQYKVSVVTFEGTIDEARKKAAEDNQKARSGMTRFEQLELTWRWLVRDMETRPTELHRRTGVSRPTIDKMKGTIAKMKAQGVTQDVMIQRGWEGCKRASWTEREGQDDYLERLERYSERFEKALSGEFGSSWEVRPDALAFFLANHHPQLARLLVDSEQMWPIVQDVYQANMLDEEQETAREAAIIRANSRNIDTPF